MQMNRVVRRAIHSRRFQKNVAEDTDPEREKGHMTPLPVKPTKSHQGLLHQRTSVNCRVKQITHKAQNFTGTSYMCA